MRLGAHDEVAGKALRCQVAYGNKTEDWPGSLRMLEAVLKFVGTESMRGRVTENVEIIKRNIEFGTCYFCGRVQAQEDAAVAVPMHGNVRKIYLGTEYVPGGTRTRYRVTWEHATPRVPRCRECKKNHAEINKMMLIGGACAVALGIILGGVLGYANGRDASDFWGGCFMGLVFSAIFALAPGIGIGWLIGKSRVPYKIKGSTDYGEFPRVKELRAQGWKNGEKPSDQEQNAAPMDRESKLW